VDHLDSECALWQLDWAGSATCACKKGASLLARLVANSQGGVCIRTLGEDRAGEMRLFRFLHNKRVTPAEMVETARARTLARVKGRHILAIQDTTSLRDASNTSRCSLQLHPTIAVDAVDGHLVGLVEAQFLKRRGGKRASTGQRAFVHKESRRWLDGTISAAELLEAGAACVTVVTDREGDVYETFALRPPEVELVIRAQQDRTLADGTLLSVPGWRGRARPRGDRVAGRARPRRTQSGAGAVRAAGADQSPAAPARARRHPVAGRGDAVVRQGARGRSAGGGRARALAAADHRRRGGLGRRRGGSPASTGSVGPSSRCSGS
jgi:hypothetical protein